MVDLLLSDDINDLRYEIVRLRTLVDNEYRLSESYRQQNVELKSIVESLINNGYGKSI